jgi:adenosylcobinamide amidohydrolase
MLPPADRFRPVPTRSDAEVLEVGAARALVVSLGGPHEVVSWAVVNGGRRQADAVVWREVRSGELGPDSDARRLMRETLAQVGRPEAVGLLTARDVRRFEEERVVRGGVRARCVATVGLGNALAAGDPTTTNTATTTTTGREVVGTINVLCAVSFALSEEALLEASALAAEARAAALLAARVPSIVSGRPASGTGTDCIVIAAPVGSGSGPAPFESFAGKHTACGSAIGAAVHAAVGRGIQRWLEENACAPR